MLCLVFSQAVLSFHVKIPCWSLCRSSICPVLFNSELKRRLKAEKKAAEKEAKIKEQPVQEACKDEETLDPNVRFIFMALPFAQELVQQFLLLLLARFNSMFAFYSNTSRFARRPLMSWRVQPRTRTHTSFTLIYLSQSSLRNTTTYNLGTSWLMSSR